ncbi:zinc ribbon domain-containing protein [Anaerorhabdus sp.]|uniref:zinc ribbon domain-containing protein n=1 Tax=Anaerorhabdus sp. TaxID=1872524 RepID=UPI002FCCAD7F
MVQDNHEGIVNKEIYENVEKTNEERIVKKVEEGGIARKYSSKNPLSNILVCKECGSSFRRVLRKRKGVRVPCCVYATNAKTGRIKCENNIVYTEVELFNLVGIRSQGDILGFKGTVKV